MIIISKLNELYLKVDSDDRGVLREISDKFSFMVPGYQYSPQYKNGVWDGRIKLFNVNLRTLYSGLLMDLIDYLKSENYQFDISDKTIIKSQTLDSEFDIFKTDVYNYTNMSVEGIYSYQMEALIKCIFYNKALILSPTGSGKSHLIYLLVRFLLQHLERDILICVPTTALCSQIIDDFDDYVVDDWIAYDNCHKIYSGQDKTSNKRVVVSTYQSLVKMSSDYFNKFDALIVDEAHQADSKSIISIIDNMAHAPWRFGLTGTLNGTKIHELCLRGLFGPTIKTKTTKELMDIGVLAKLKIVAYKLKYSADDRKLVRKLHSEYQTEIKWILENVNRNSFLINKAFETTKNTLILFNMSEHGKELLRIANDMNANGTKQIFFMNGNTKTDEREEIRKNLELINDAILIASYGVFSVGANVKNIDFVMFAHPYKARIRNLQSIGRSIRKKDGKDFATLIDIGDDLTQNKKPNITYSHFTSRLKIYTAEQFDYIISEVDM